MTVISKLAPHAGSTRGYTFTLQSTHSLVFLFIILKQLEYSLAPIRLGLQFYPKDT